MIRRVLIGIVSLVVVLYGGLLVYLYINQRAFFFFPEGSVRDLAQTRLDAAVVQMPTADGATITGWYGEPEPGYPVILYYKGNTASFADEFARYETFQQAGYGFLAFDYRGFPASPGDITQDNVLADGLAAFDWLSAQEHKIVIWGRSLGAAPAVHTASLRQPEAVLLETPFYSAANVASERYPFVPVALLMHDPFPSHEWIADVTAPVMIAHGTADLTISVANGERLYAEVPNPAGLWIVPGAGHGDLWARGIWAEAERLFAPVVETGMAAAE